MQLVREGIRPSLALPTRQLPEWLNQIGTMSLPVSASFLTIFGFLFVFNHLVSFFGKAEVAGFGAAYRIQSFVVLPAIALGTALAILINRAIVSGEFPLIRRYFLTGIALAFAIYAAVGAGVFLFQKPLLRFFTSEPSEIAAGMRYLTLVASSYFSFGPVLFLLTLMEQTGYGVRAFMVNLVAFSLELGFASLFGLQHPTATTLYLVVAVGNWLAVGYLLFEVLRRTVARRAAQSALPTSK